jgi:hypothetical protein
VGAAEANRITQAFFVAARDGDTALLASLLAEEVDVHSDGGGKVLAFRNVIRGLDRALRLFAGLRRTNAPTAQLLRTAEIDGLPGYISVDCGFVQTTALPSRQDHCDLHRSQPRQVAALGWRYDRLGSDTEGFAAANSGRPLCGARKSHVNDWNGVRSRPALEQPVSSRDRPPRA